MACVVCEAFSVSIVLAILSLLNLTTVYSFSLLYMILFFGYITIYLSTLLLMNPQMPFTFYLLRIIPLYTLLALYLYDYLDTDSTLKLLLNVELLRYSVCIHSYFVAKAW